MKPETGSVAPDFSAKVIGGEYKEESELSLSDLRGRRVVLVFYPKDNTPGCTTQACEIRDQWENLGDDVLVFGVSPDSVKSHSTFIEKQNLPYPLIADTEKEIVEAYGVWVEKQMYGKTYMGVERSTFVIEKDGTILAVLSKVKPALHWQQLTEVLTQA